MPDHTPANPTALSAAILPRGHGLVWSTLWLTVGGATFCFFMEMARLYSRGQQLEATLPDLILPPPGAARTPAPEPAAIEPPPALLTMDVPWLTLAFGCTALAALAWVRVLVVSGQRRPLPRADSPPGPT